MKSTLFVPIAKRLSVLIEHGYKLFNLKDEYHNNEDYKDDVEGFVNGLTDKSQRIDLALLRNEVSREGFIHHLIEATKHCHCDLRDHCRFCFLAPSIQHQKITYRQRIKN